jgi:peptide/nickel transport system permease protein
VGARRYLIRKTLHAVGTLVFVLTFNFFLFRVMPGDPIALLARSERLSPAGVAEQRAAFGLDRPLASQYVFYLGQTLTGELGVSLRTARPIWDEISARIGPTVLLVGIGTLLSTVLGVLIGIKGGWHRGSRFDTTTLYGSWCSTRCPRAGWACCC